MQPVFSSTRARLAASAAAVLGVSTLGACERKAAPQPAPQPTPIQSITAPPPVDVQQPVDAQQPVYIEEPAITTLAIGEEEGGSVPPVDGYVTTFAIGEEDGTGPIPVEPDGGIGDGAGPIPIEQVDGDFERIYIPPEPGIGDRPVGEPVATTLAIGEEG